MKIFISADMEGITGVTAWSETELNNREYEKMTKQMTAEVWAACNGALAAGASEIVIKDAHDTGRNIILDEMPRQAKVIRGWSGHPFSMVQGLDGSFDAAVFIGYHSPSGSNRNPLSHTMHPSDINYIKINGTYASEFLLHAYAAATVGVPVVFASGDKGLCDEISAINPNIGVAAVKQGIGDSTISLHPLQAIELIEKGTEKSVKQDIKSCLIQLPPRFEVELAYTDHKKAYRASFYPGMKQISAKNVLFNCSDFFDVLRMILFLV